MIKFSDHSKHVYAYDATGRKLRAEYHTPIQPYKYNGKELDRHHGLEWYDYGARWYNGYSWTTPDPFNGAKNQKEIIIPIISMILKKVILMDVLKQRLNCLSDSTNTVITGIKR